MGVLLWHCRKNQGTGQASGFYSLVSKRTESTALWCIEAFFCKAGKKKKKTFHSSLEAKYSLNEVLSGPKMLGLKNQGYDWGEICSVPIKAVYVHKA